MQACVKNQGERIWSLGKENTNKRQHNKQIPLLSLHMGPSSSGFHAGMVSQDQDGGKSPGGEKAFAIFERK